MLLVHKICRVCGQEKPFDGHKCDEVCEECNNHAHQKQREHSLKLMAEKPMEERIAALEALVYDALHPSPAEQSYNTFFDRRRA